MIHESRCAGSAPPNGAGGKAQFCGSARRIFIGYVVSGGTRRFEGANLETESELCARVMRCEFCGFAEAARHDKPVAAKNLLGLAERPVSANARFGNHCCRRAES